MEKPFFTPPLRPEVTIENEKDCRRQFTKKTLKERLYFRNCIRSNYEIKGKYVKVICGED